MNIRISFLIVALLVGVCGAARCQDLPPLPEPVLAVQRCFPQATTVRLLPEMRYNDEIYTPQLLELFNPQFETPRISPDGKRLFFHRGLEDRRWQSYFLDLTTGQLSLAKMRDQQPVDYGGEPLHYIDDGVWDPVEPAYLYVVIFERAIDNDRVLYTVCRMNVETLVGTPILPPGHYGLRDITPDGRDLRVYRRDEDYRPYLYSLETHTWTPLPEDMTLAWPIYAPNGELVAWCTEPPDPVVLAIRDVTTDRLAQVFNENQALFSLPHGSTPLLIGVPTWLPDSAGLLVNIVPIKEDGANIIVEDDANTIWQVGINGEAAAIATGVAVIANSQNGRHWLLQHEEQFYVMTVDDTAPEE